MSECMKLAGYGGLPGGSELIAKMEQREKLPAYPDFPFTVYRSIEGCGDQEIEVLIRVTRLKAEAKRLREEAERLSDPIIFEQAEKLEEKVLDAQMATELSAGPVVIVKPKGLVVKTRLNFQITDAHVFCQAYPDFWNWNADAETLKLKRREILEELNKEHGVFHQSKFPEELPDHKDSRIVKPAGMRVFEDLTSHIR